MTFVQQSRRPKYNKYIESASSIEEEEEEIVERREEEFILQPSIKYQRTNSISDTSDTDWHILIPSSSSQSGIEDTEDESIISEQQELQEAITYLPSHDGTGTFLLFDSDQQTTSEEESVHKMTTTDEEEDMVIEPPSFKPTITGLNSQELTNQASSSDISTFLSDEGNVTKRYHHDLSKRQKNLDSIPIHHPSNIRSTITLLSIVWNNILRFRNHLIENDTNTLETISTIMSEAVFEGYLPFSSHLHMEFDNSLHTSSSHSFFDGHISI